MMVAMVSCILFIAIELLQGSHKGARLAFGAYTTATSTIAALEPVFRHLGTCVVPQSIYMARTSTVQLRFF